MARERQKQVDKSITKIISGRDRGLSGEKKTEQCNGEWFNPVPQLPLPHAHLSSLHTCTSQKGGEETFCWLFLFFACSPASCPTLDHTPFSFQTYSTRVHWLQSHWRKPKPHSFILKLSLLNTLYFTIFTEDITASWCLSVLAVVVNVYTLGQVDF